MPKLSNTIAAAKKTYFRKKAKRDAAKAEEKRKYVARYALKHELARDIR